MHLKARATAAPLLLIAILLVLHVRAGTSRSYLAGSLNDGDVPLPYSDDPQDCWNRIFSALFTRDVTTQLTEDLAPTGASLTLLQSVGNSGHRRVSSATFVRHEGGDRPIAPLYPSFFSNVGRDQLMAEPRYSAFLKAMREALSETAKRPPVERALMQADLWAAYDMIFASTSAAGVPAVGEQRQRSEILPLLARLIHQVALTKQEIEQLPDNYSADAALPAVFRADSGWVEIEWRPQRSHDHDTAMRTVSRVFVKPRTPPADIDAFVNRLRPLGERRVDPGDELEATALVTQQSLITCDGSVAPTRLTIDVQIRRFLPDQAGHFKQTLAEEFELSRERLRLQRGGGFVRESPNFPAYLASAGNDYRFASPQFLGLGSKLPVLGTLSARCSSCHGEGLGTVFTFAAIFPEKLPRVRVLTAPENEHARFVAHEKASRADFQALLASW